MPALTRVPAVVDALIGLFGSATGLQVLDGPHIGEVMFEAICVGLSPDQSRPGYDAVVTQLPGMGAPRYVEEWTISSLLSISSGQTDLAALRARAGAALEQIDVALRAGQVAPEVWQRAGFGQGMQWLPLQHPDGASVSVFFDVVGASVL